MAFIKIIFFYFIMILVPLVISNVLVDRTYDIHERYAVGFSLMLFFLQVFCVPAQLANMKFHYVYYVFLISIFTLVLISAYKMYRDKSFISKPHFCEFCKSYIESKQQKISMMVFFSVVVIEVLIYVFLSNPASSYDDSLYLARSANIVYSDSLATDVDQGAGSIVSMKYAVTSWDVFIAVISKLTGINSAIVARTLLPTVFLPMAYSLLFLVANFLFDEKENIWLFMILVSILSVFGSFGPTTAPASLVLKIWQGRSVLFTIFVPFLFVLINKINSMEFKISKAVTMFVVSMAGCSLSPTAVLMVAIEVCAMGLTCIIYYKQIKKSLAYILSGLIAPMLLGLVFVIWR